MTEHETVSATKGMPGTVESIRAGLTSLGVTPGMVLLVHSSLSSLGWVCGGAVTVVLALEEALGPHGTLVMPTHSGDLSEPSRWKHPPVPEAWWASIRQTMPAYNDRMTPTRGVGVIPECFRNQEGTIRSAHPSASFAARGKHANTIVAKHPLDYPMGDDSPLARIYDLDGWVLLLGATFECASSLHLAEHLASYPSKEYIKCGAPVEIDGRRTWVEYDDFEGYDQDFATIGASFAEETGLVISGRILNATAHLLPQRPLVDFAVRWIETNRK
jgi:aminoglycoside 3-N-acetyltransferase